MAEFRADTLSCPHLVNYYSPDNMPITTKNALMKVTKDLLITKSAGYISLPHT